MANVENRVVAMKFDNAAFERGVANTLSTLGKLKSALGNMAGAAKNLGDFKVNSQGLAPLSHGVDALVTKFSALQVAGVTAIANIANKAVNAGTQMANSLTIAPISGGMGEYEKKLQSIQTILANTQSAGTNLEQVSSALTELNHYSDKTIYNFGEMAKNIGTFTAAGVDLDTAVGSIKGIANLAALSGSSSEQASGAMYQLSQAISAGKVSLMDWNSVVNAGMGGSVFQRSLAETAVAMGKLPESALKLEGAMKNVKINGASFRESIDASKGPSWLTSDVLTTALKNFTGDMKEADLVAQGFSKSQAAMIMQQAKMASDAATKVKTGTQLMSTLRETAESGWAETWELIIGDFNEAPKLWTSMSDALGGIIKGSADARNKVLSDWRNNNGRHFFLVALKNAWLALKSIVGPITEAFRDIFPATTGKQLADLSENFMKFTKGLILGQEKMDQLKRTFRGIFAVVNIFTTIVKGALSAVFGLIFDGAQAGGGGILALTATFGDLLYGLSRILTYRDAIGKFFDVFAYILIKPVVALVQVIMSLISAVSLLAQGDISGFKERFSTAFQPVSEYLDGIKTKFVDFFTAISGTFGALATFLDSTANKLKASGNAAGAGIIEGLSTVATFFQNFYKDAGGTLTKLIQSFTDVSTQGATFLNGIGGSGLDKLKAVITEINNKLVEFREKLNFSANFAKFNDGAGETASGGISAFSKALSIAGAVWSGISSIFSGLGNFLGPFLADLGKIFTTIVSKIRSYIETMDNQDLIALINTGILAVLVLGFRKFIGEMTGFFKSGQNMFDSIGGTFDKLKTSLSALTGAVRASIVMQIAIAVGVLVAALFILAKIDSNALKQALITLGVLFAQMTAMMYALTKIPIEKLAGAGAALTGIAIAILILANAVKKLGEMDPKVLVQGGIAIASIMGALAGFSVLMNMAPMLVRTAASLVILSVALTMMAAVIALYAAIPTSVLEKGLLSMAAVLVILGFALNAFNEKKILSKAIAITLIAKAMLVLSAAVAILGMLPMEVLAKGIIAMGAALLVLAAGANLMNGSLLGASAILIMATAITALVPALALLGALPFDVLLKGLVGIAAIMAIFVVGMYALAPVIVVLSLFSTALLVMGGAILLAATGFMIFVKALGLMVLIGAAGFAVIAAGITTLLALLPLMAQQAGYAFVTFVKVIRDSAPKLIEAAGHIIVSFVKEIARRIPEIAAAGLDMLLGILKAIRDRIGDIVTVAAEIVTNFLGALKEQLPEIIQMGVDFILSFVEGLAAAIRGEKERTGEAGSDLAMALVEGVISGLKSLGTRLFSEIVKIGVGLVKSFKDFLGINSPSTVFAGFGRNLIEGLIKGIGSLVGNLGGKVREVGGKAITAIREAFGGAVDAGRTFITKIISGIGGAVGGLLTEGRKAVRGAITAAKEAVGQAKDIGENIIKGIVKGISGGFRAVTDAAKEIAKKALNAAKDFLGIKSPSKEFQKIGQFVNQGFVKGLTDGSSATATATYNNMKAVLSEAMKAATEDIKEHEAKLKTLTSARVRDGAAIAKVRLALAESRSELVKATAAHKTLTTTHLNAQRTITKLGTEYEGLTKKLEDANKVLDDAIKTRDDYAKSTADKYDDLLDMTAETKILTAAEKKAQLAAEEAKSTEASAKAGERAAASAKRKADAEDKIAALRDQAVDPEDSAYEQGVKARAAEREIRAIEREQKAAEATEAAEIAKEAAAAEAAKASEAAAVKEGVGVTEYIEGLRAKAEEVKKFGTLLQQLREQGLNDQAYEELLTKGVEAMPFMEKLASMGPDAIRELNTVTSALTAEAKKLGNTASKSLYDAGVASAQGLVNGIKSRQSTIIAEMERLATAMLTAIKKKLGIKSPSREFAKIGGFASSGMAQGLKAGVGEINSAADFVAESSLRTMKDTMARLAEGLSAEMDLNPTVAPVLDLSAMKKEAKNIGSVLGINAIAIDAAYSGARAASAGYNGNRDAASETAAAVATEPVHLEFKQYNSSPKALSSAELYRNTKNQLSVAKEALEDATSR